MSRYSRPFSVGVKPPLTATSLQRPLFWLTVHTFTLVSTSLQRSLFWRTVHTLTLVSTSLQRPLFWLTVHTFTLVSTSLQRPLCSVPKVAVVDRFNCKILRSANAKYQFYPFFYKINKGDLPLMYSSVFWCEVIYLVGFWLSFGL